MPPRPSPRASFRRAAGMLAGAVVVVVSVLTGHVAVAKTDYDSLYGYDRTWNSAVRLVRVDNGWKIVEKDAAMGYLLFEYTSPEGGAKATSGSIEMIRPKEPNEPVKVIVQLPQMPRFHEQVLLNALSRKLRADYGDPPSRRAAPAAPAPADAGTDVDPAP